MLATSAVGTSVVKSRPTSLATDCMPSVSKFRHRFQKLSEGAHAGSTTDPETRAMAGKLATVARQRTQGFEVVRIRPLTEDHHGGDDWNPDHHTRRHKVEPLGDVR